MRSRQYIIILIVLASFGSLHSLAQTTAKDFFKAGKKAASAGNAQEAILKFTYALKLSPDDYDLLVARGKQFDVLKDYEKALRDYEDALALKDRDEKILMRAADLNMYFDKYEQAMKLLNLILSYNNGDIEALEKIVRCQIKEKHYTDALESAKFAIDKYSVPNEFDFHYQMGIAYDSLKKYSDAIREFELALKQRMKKDNNKSPISYTKPLLISTASANYKAKLYDAAIKNYGSALLSDSKDSIYPKNASIYYFRSFAYLAQSDYTNAIGDLTRVIIANPTEYSASLQRANVYFIMRQYLSAISDFTIFLKYEPKNAEALRNRAKCYFELQNYQEAYSDIRKAYDLSKASDDSDLMKEIGKVLFDQNKEMDIPEIVLDYPKIDESDFINVLTFQYEVLLIGKIKDKSKIKSILINGNEVLFNKSQLNPEFLYHLPLSEDISIIELEAIDMYDNKASKSVKIGRIISNAKNKVVFAGKILVDNSMKTPYKNKKVYLINSKGEVIMVVYTDENGSFKFMNLPYDQNYMLALEENFTTEKVNFIIADANNNKVLKTDDKERFKFQLLLNDFNVMSLMTVDDAPLTIDFKGKIFGANEEKTPLTNITLMLLNEKGEVVSTRKTDAFGAFLFSRLMPKENYTIRTNPNEFNNYSFEKIYITDENGKIIKELFKNSGGYFDYQLLPTEKIYLARISEPDPWFNVNSLSKSKRELLIVENIYYPTDAYLLSEEATIIVEKALDILTKNKQLTIEIQSHTDAIASDDYNLLLSQKRANEVVKYLIDKGVDKSRLSAKGFGETQLINRCKNGVECSQEEHKQNRRTVFKINYNEK